MLPGRSYATIYLRKSPQARRRKAALIPGVYCNFRLLSITPSLHSLTRTLNLIRSTRWAISRSRCSVQVRCGPIWVRCGSMRQLVIPEARSHVTMQVSCSEVTDCWHSPADRHTSSAMHHEAHPAPHYKKFHLAN